MMNADDLLESLSYLSVDLKQKALVMLKSFCYQAGEEIIRYLGREETIFAQIIQNQ